MKYLKLYERFDISDFKIGDIVLVNGIQSDLQINNQIGRVIYIVGDSITVKFDHQFSDSLHSDYDQDGGRKSWNLNKHRDIEITKIEINYVHKDITELLSLHIPDKDLWNNDMLYINITDKIDTLSFITKKRLNDVENPYDNRYRQEIKIGRFLNKIIEDKKTIENAVNQYKTNYKRKFNLLYFELVKGENIRYWYDGKNYKYGGGQLNKSCMRYDTVQSVLDIYVDNPGVCKLLILKENKDSKLILGRALIWKTNKGIYMDRPYCRYDDDIKLYNRYAKDREWGVYDHIKNSPKMHVDLIDKDFGKPNKNPYMDTFKKYFSESNKLANYNNINWGPFVELNYY